MNVRRQTAADIYEQPRRLRADSDHALAVGRLAGIYYEQGGKYADELDAPSPVPGADLDVTAR